MRKLLAILLTSICLCSCASDNGKYSYLSTKPITLYSINNDNTIVAENAEASSSRHVAIIIPSGKAPTLGSAINEILNTYDGDYLTNVSVERKTFQIFFWYHYKSWEISGDVIRAN